jgi:hypothetical protein
MSGFCLHIHAKLVSCARKNARVPLRQKIFRFFGILT